ncbi:MAG: Gmad2 immunoglobulin-like domain-containing protein [bacterium]|nr:Gmad2 immunoglobulin-like domain-containing protein [bacterium]
MGTHTHSPNELKVLYHDDMKKVYLLTAILITIAIIVAFVFLLAPKAAAPNGTTDKSNLIRVTSPTANQIVQSPLIISGTARGYWFFEASFPVKLLDGNGVPIAVVPAQAKDDWMTENFVPFSATLEFTAPTTGTGTLILEKDNPSGLPEHADEIRVPIRFR